MIPAGPSLWPPVPALPMADDSAFGRLWRGFMTARVTIALALLVLLGLLYGLGFARSPNTGWLLALCGSYFVAAVAVRSLSRPTPPGKAFDAQWVSTIGIDLLAFSTLQFLQAGSMNYLPLFALPALTAGVLGSFLLAMGTSAGVTLLLLLDAWLASLHAPDDTASRFLQAGLTGIGYFAVAVLANQLSVRLAREEDEARRSRMAARTQAQVNELVVEHLGDGVLVVGARSQVYTANPAARRLLGCDSESLTMPFELTSRSPWLPLADLARRTLEERQPQRAELTLNPAPGERQLVHVRTRPTPQQASDGEGLCVMFLEDLREMAARLRTEKLAAMGRMSAAVAHEIRNPLAAITQANALLDEELTDPSQRQLSTMVQQNAHRLAQIVDEILDLTRVQLPSSADNRLLVDDVVGGTVDDWVRQMQAAERLHLQLGCPDTWVVFQPEQLRRVLVNLLDNALRYAGRAPDSISVFTDPDGNGAVLRVWSDGAPLEQGVQRHLFEPFFSSESRSSGLGLYICRELCERHGATIGYRRAPACPGGREGNEFLVRLPSRAPDGFSGQLAFDTISA